MSIRASEADRGGTASGRMAWSGDKKKQSSPSYETNQERSNKGCWSVFSGCVGVINRRNIEKQIFIMKIQYKGQTNQ
ncbi:hypothetical protein Anas_00502 [Armadillidium nasatum]|uniref:Uncharacterized protein n=1 Tax=Armadillidium nasatum TaxID=96803 RepID=A0A5N5T905_9CRUS|nr:hypothetical protein Anas_00502 [Armadillidium nasatum]